MRRLFHGGKVAGIALDEHVPHTVLLCCGENLRPVNRSGTYFGEMFCCLVLNLGGGES
jgi:hypothetical protein